MVYHSKFSTKSKLIIPPSLFKQDNSAILTANYNVISLRFLNQNKWRRIFDLSTYYFVKHHDIPEFRSAAVQIVDKRCNLIVSQFIVLL